MYYYPPCQEFLNFTEQSLVDVVVVGGNVAVVVGGCGGGFSARHVWGHPLFVCVYGFKIVDHQGFGITKQPTINTSSEDPSQIMTMRWPSPPLPKSHCPQVLLICGLQSQPAGCPKEDRHFADAYHQSSSPSTTYRERREGKRGRKRWHRWRVIGNVLGVFGRFVLFFWRKDFDTHDGSMGLYGIFTYMTMVDFVWFSMDPTGIWYSLMFFVVAARSNESINVKRVKDWAQSDPPSQGFQCQPWLSQF